MALGIGILIAAVVVVIGIALYAAVQITGIPYLAVPYTPGDYGLPSENVTFESEDHLKLTGWFIRAKKTSDTTIIILHGLGSNAGDMLLNVLAIAEAGQWNLFLINFRGHADSEGSKTSLGPLELDDFESALEFAKKKYPAETRRLGVYGHSLGASVAVVGAARHPEILAVLAESPFARTRDTIMHFSRLFYGLPAFPFIYLALVFTRFRLGVSQWSFAPIREVGAISPRPFFLIAAERDLRMPAAETEAFFNAAKDPKELWVVPGADHGEPWMVAKEEYDRRTVDFFRRVFP